MEEILQSIVLGIVQGLTEFLPVSSSGHLELAKIIMNDDSLAEQSLLMTVSLHGATALSTLLVFRKDIVELVKSLWPLAWNESWKFTIAIVVSMLPAVIIGLAFEEQIEMLFSKQLLLVGLMLIITGILLFLADKAKTTNKSVGLKDAFLIGIAQAIAILPGISRSGATISTSVLLKIDRSKAAQFSFLMVVPLIFGKIAKDILDFDSTASIATDSTSLIVGFIFAFLTGLIACTWMIKLVKNAKLSYFSIYCFIVGIIAIIANFL